MSMNKKNSTEHYCVVNEQDFFTNEQGFFTNEQDFFTLVNDQNIQKKKWNSALH